jgi:hypothetical protein
MFFDQRILLRFVRDDRGAYGVMFALSLGFLGLAAHVGIDALRVQNSATAAEQLVDIACQKIATADPALYPTADDLKMAIEKQMQNRGVMGSNAGDGVITVEKRLTHADLVIPVTNRPYDQKAPYTDFRRFTFDVSYTGKVGDLHKDIKSNKDGAVKVAKPCRPVCSGMNNVIYSSPNAVGHWFNKGTMFVGQKMDKKKAFDKFDPAPYLDGYKNGMSANERLVITAMTPEGAIRYRTVVDSSQMFYFDDNADTAPGEPRQKGMKRIDVNFGDQIFVQKMNADGSLPGMCGEAESAGPCTGSGCEPPSTQVGDKCGEGSCRPRPDTYNSRYKCDFGDRTFPYTDGVRYPDLPQVDFYRSSVKFVYPPRGKNEPGLLTLSSTSRDGTVSSYEIALAPNYFPNNREKRTIKFANGVSKTLTNEVASAYNFTARSRWALRVYAKSHYLVHIAGLWTFWFNGIDDCIASASPIVFDTAGLGQIITTRNSDEAAKVSEPQFDIFGTGEKTRVEWLRGEGQGWLVDNRDGRAAQDMSGRRFFGDLDGREHGYAKLAELDTSGTGILSGVDLDGLALWFDDGDALVDEGELRTLRELGITAVDTRGTWQTLDDGRDVLRSTAIMNGRTIMTEDIFVEIRFPTVPVEALLSTDDR